MSKRRTRTPTATPLNLEEWVRSAAAPVGGACRICASKAAREWYDLACAAMASVGSLISDRGVAERLSADTGLTITLHTVRTHRGHSESWRAAAESVRG